ncbi:SMP-30/gluconolactonase/LRE family protein [Planctomycetales bacterium ZRK34]|nr:SMP-30/gluconolactonase/LRE family protein [Planctomycetales bacterium ZRK34]
MNIRTLTSALLITIIASAAGAQADPIVPDGSSVEILGAGFKFTEGPAWDGERYVYFSDIPNAHVIRYDTQTGVSIVFVPESGSSNGLMFNKAGQLILCQHAARQVGRLEKDGSITTLVDSYDGKKLNSPNDLDFDAKGGIYFTDPRYGNRDNMEQSIEAVYYLSPDKKLMRVVDDLVRPNGILVSNDRKHLYVADHGAGKVYAFDIQSDATLKNKRLLIALNDKDEPDGDGMTLDSKGNLYITSPRTSCIMVVAPDGKLITKIHCPKPPANCAFGGADRKTLYITARDSFYRITLNIPGR